MLSSFFKTVFLTGFLLSLPASAPAARVSWTLTGLVFTDGGTASGTFTYDADLKLYSDIHVTTTAGSTRAGAYYDEVIPYVNPLYIPSSTTVRLATTSGNLAGTPQLLLSFQPNPLSNYGGVLFFAPQSNAFQEATCDESGCFHVLGPGRWAIAGSAAGIGTETTPEPSTMILLGGGLLALVQRRRLSPAAS